ncbi:hypothetical protein [Amedibacillus sp. YH-ame10]
MEKWEENFYKANHKLYILLILNSILIMVVGAYLIENKIALVGDIVKNLAYGCVASSLISWLIEIGNFRIKNKEIARLRQNLYNDTVANVYHYLGMYARIYFKESEAIINKEKYTWDVWYDLLKASCLDLKDQKAIKDVFDFLKQQVVSEAEFAFKSLDEVVKNRFSLYLNNGLDYNLYYDLKDLHFEFSVINLTYVERYTDLKDLFDYLDAINTDLKNYVQKCNLVNDMNEFKFNPKDFYEEIIKIL